MISELLATQEESFGTDAIYVGKNAEYGAPHPYIAVGETLVIRAVGVRRGRVRRAAFRAA
jgi:hypothetical protein